MAVILTLYTPYMRSHCSKLLMPQYVTIHSFVFPPFCSTVKPESTSLSSNRNNNTFLRGENVTLLCSSLSKPQRCNVTFYNGSKLIKRYTDMICNGSVAARHIIPYIDGCGWRNFSCKADNEYGSSGLGDIALTINGINILLPCLLFTFERVFGAPFQA